MIMFESSKIPVIEKVKIIAAIQKLELIFFFQNGSKSLKARVDQNYRRRFSSKARDEKIQN